MRYVKLKLVINDNIKKIIMNHRQRYKQINKNLTNKGNDILTYSRNN